jgi:hypothetical protein
MTSVEDATTRDPRGAPRSVFLARRAANWAAVRPYTATLLGLAVLFVLLAALTWGTWGDLDSDTGYDSIAAQHVANGDLPYRDFIYYYGPLAPALLGLLTLVGGAGFGTAVFLGFVVTAAIAMATFALARVLLNDPLATFLATALAVAVAFIPDDFNYVLPHTNAATLGTLLLLLSLLAIWKYSSTGADRWLWAVGTCVGLALLTKPEPAFAALAAVAVWLGLRLVHRVGAWTEVRRVAIPLVAIPALVYGGLLGFVSPHKLFLENLYPVDAFAAGGSEDLRNRMPLTISGFADAIEKVLIYGVGVLAIAAAAAAVARGGRIRTVTYVIVGAVGAAIVGAALVKSEALRHGLEFAYGWIPAAAAAAAVIVVWRLVRRRATLTPERQVEAAALIALSVVAATIYHGFFPNAPAQQMAVYYMPLAAIFLARLHLVELARSRPAYVIGAAWVLFLAAAGAGLTLKDAHSDSRLVRGPGGAIAETPAEAQLYQRSLQAIETRTRRGEPILIAPLMAGLSTLSQRPPALQEISVLPDALPSRADELRAIQRLERRHVRLAVIDDRAWPGYGNTTFGDSFDRTLAQWIAAHFRKVEVIRVPPHHTPDGFQPARAVTIWFRAGA